ncbi:MAG TPA: phenylalanine--tRNA ligase subunit beta, partial [Thermodesulfovibrionia bacterium]|nr:phenylalanine--tRNA ligase subunit beta [Thermodesulfovibrionia bacterium]
QGIIVVPPGFRQDIQRDIDVIEEIARLYGYSKIPSTLPKTETQPLSLSQNIRWNLIKKIKDSMRKSGYSEVINYSFLNPSDLDRLKLFKEDTRRELIKIKNPLKKEEEALRTTLIPALLNNVRLNISHGEKSLRFFEISSIFLYSGQDLPIEPLKMAAIYLKDKKGLMWQDKHDGFYDLKGALENLFFELRIKNYLFKQDFSLIEPYLHPGKSCVININDQTVGFLGTLHPEVADNFEVPSEINILELDIDKVCSLISPKIMYKSLPKYPYIERDIAIIVPENVTVSDAEKTMLDIDTDIIESVMLFDIYSGKPIPQGKKSLAFSIRYRAGDRTLTDDEVNQIHNKIIKKLEDSLKAELRS